MTMTQRDLVARGFERRTAYDEPRLSEIVEMYEEMGYQVHLAPFVADEEPGCSECMKHDPDRYKVIYTRVKEN